MKSFSGNILIKILLLLGILFIAYCLLAPSIRIGPGPSSQSLAKNDLTQIANAALAYEAEYIKLPGVGQQPVSGPLLQALLGKNDTLNPRKIVFLEVLPAGKGESGLSNGAFVDPWGGPYQIAFTQGELTSVTAGTNNIPVLKRVAVWTDPRLATKPSWWNNSPEAIPQYLESWE